MNKNDNASKLHGLAKNVQTSYTQRVCTFFKRSCSGASTNVDSQRSLFRYFPGLHHVISVTFKDWNGFPEHSTAGKFEGKNSRTFTFRVFLFQKS